MESSLERILRDAVRQHQSGRLDRAKSLYEQALAKDPHNPDALHLLGLLWFHGGESERAANLICEAIQRQPDFAPFHDDLAMVYLGTGDFQQALEALRSAQRLEGESAHRCFNLAVVLEKLGRDQEAEGAYRRAVQLDPGDSECHFNLGNLLRGSGRREEAAAAYRSALEIDPAAVGALTNLANLCLELGREKEALVHLERLVRLLPGDRGVHLALGRAMLLTGRYEDAALELLKVLRDEPDNAHACKALGSALRQLEPRRHMPELAAPLEGLFRTPAVHPQTLARISANQLRHKYDLPAGMRRVEAYARSLASRLEEDPLFLELMTTTVNTDPALETFIVPLRRFLLDQLFDRESTGIAYPNLTTALAQQCFANEYLYESSEEEAGRVEKLTRELDDVTATGAHAGSSAENLLLCVAMYRPIAELRCADVLARTPMSAWSARIRPLVERMLMAPRREAELAARIPSLAGAEAPVSGAVRRQYEENPYPRWRSLHVERRPAYGTDLKTMFPHFQPAECLNHPLTVLAAGCGTGQEAAAIAHARPECEVIGLDLSRASLSYAARMAADLGISNLSFYQGDIAHAALLERRFQVIECTGVLHHLASPESGWRALADCLDPGGLMKIGLYSELASAEVRAARAVIRQEGIGAGAREIRAFRSRILSAKPRDPLYPLRFSEDLYTLSGCRDLLFHVQEQCFTLQRIGRALEKLGLAFIGFEHAAPGIRQRYVGFNPADRTLTDLEGWARFESAHPRTFAAMYVFWCCKTPE